MNKIINAIAKKFAKSRLRALSFAPGACTQAVIGCLERLCAVLREQLKDGERTASERASFVDNGVDAIEAMIREVQNACFIGRRV